MSRMSKRNYAALPHEYLEEMQDLTDAEFGRLCRALLKYSATGEKVQLCGNERYCMRRVCMQEDRFQLSYQGMIESKSQAGKKGAEVRWRDESAQGDGEGSNSTSTKKENGTRKHKIADDSRRLQTVADDNENGYTKTETKTETKTNTERKQKKESAGELSDGWIDTPSTPFGSLSPDDPFSPEFLQKGPFSIFVKVDPNLKIEVNQFIEAFKGHDFGPLIRESYAKSTAEKLRSASPTERTDVLRSATEFWRSLNNCFNGET